MENVCSESCFWKRFWPPFVDLINSVASRNVWKLLNLSYLQKVVKTFFKNTIYLVNKFEKMIKLGLKSTRRGLFGRKNVKLRIQGRMQIFEKMSQMALNQVLILPSFRAQKMLQIRLKIMDLQNNWFCGKLKHCKFRILVPMSYIMFL